MTNEFGVSVDQGCKKIDTKKFKRIAMRPDFFVFQAPGD